MASPLVVMRGVTKEYGTLVKTKVLKGIDLEVGRGEFASIIGGSGSGKSTLLNILGALDRPTAGEIIIDQTDLASLNDDGLADFRNRIMGFVFQFHYLLPEFSVLENVLIPSMIKDGRVTPKAREMARELLDLVGVAHRQQNRANAISGGEQQRVAIARALVNNPRLVLADEPTGNLDSVNSEKIFTLLRKINRERGTTFVLVTHNRHIAARTDRIVEIKDGLVEKNQDITGKSEVEIWPELLPSNCQMCPKGQKSEVGS